MLTRWQPFGDVRTELSKLNDEMNRLFSRYTNGGREFSPAGYPPLNVWEDDNNLYVEAELPGFALDELEMYVTGENQLSIKGGRKQPQLQRGTWHRQERGYGQFSRSLELPYAIDSDKVQASFSHGMLKIELPRAAADLPKKISIQAS